jgi:hypothetical protein
MIEDGFVRIREMASWFAEYLHEVTAFPKGKQDADAGLKVRIHLPRPINVACGHLL